MDQITDSTGLWGETAPEPPPTTTLEGEVACDVAVIGAGFTGLSAALAAAEQGARVAVVEAHGLGHGGSGRNVGLVNAGMWMPYEDICKAMGDTAGNRLIGVLERAPEHVFNVIEKYAIDCEATRKGTLNCAHSKAALRRLAERVAYRQKLGSDVDILDASDTARRTGTASGVYTGALFDKDAGTIQPLSYAYGLARAAITAGAKIYTNSPALSLDRDGGNWRLRANAGVILANKVLIAVGAYGRDIPEAPAPVSGGDNVPLYFFQCATNPLSDDAAASVLPGGEGVWDTDPVMKSIRRDKAGRLIFGSVGQLENLGNLHAIWASRTVNKIFPQLNLKNDYNSWPSRWYGRIGMTGDHLPKLIQPSPGVVSVYGFNGRGIGPGTIFGQDIARYFNSGDEKDLSLPITDHHSERLPGLRGLGIETAVRFYHAARTLF